MTSVKYFLTVALGLSLLVTQAAQAQEWLLEDLLTRVAVTPPATVAFTEERHSAMLQQPLLFSGQLHYLAPGHLVKTIEQPFQETLEVTQQRIEISRDGRTQRLSMKSNRMLQTLFGGIEAMLAGDMAQLQEQFLPSLSTEEAGWKLLLKPRQPRIAEHLQQIVVRGNSASVQSIRIQFDEQEWQLMELHPDQPEAP